MLLNDFTINYRGVGITPQSEHRFDGDVLKYDYGDYHVIVTFDFTMYDSSYKKAYIENVKYVAEQGLNELRERTLNNVFDNMGVR